LEIDQAGEEGGHRGRARVSPDLCSHNEPVGGGWGDDEDEQ